MPTRREGLFIAYAPDAVVRCEIGARCRSDGKGKRACKKAVLAACNNIRKRPTSMPFLGVKAILRKAPTPRNGIDVGRVGSAPGVDDANVQPQHMSGFPANGLQNPVRHSRKMGTISAPHEEVGTPTHPVGS